MSAVGERQTSASAQDERSQGEVTAQERRFLAILGLPTLALALAITTVTTYLPVIARQFAASNVVIGAIICIEGLMALWVPLVGGSWSDQLQTRWGGRLPFLLAGAPFVAGALVLMALVRSIVLLVPVAAIFFLAYFTAYEPYRAFYPDLIDEHEAGRAQSTQALFRGLGTGLALLGGGLLIGLWKAAPFVLSALLLLVLIAAFAVTMIRHGIGGRESSQGMTISQHASRYRELLSGHPALRTFLIANGLWELSLGAMKTFVFLYLTDGLRLSSTEAACGIAAGAVFVLGGAAGSGKLGDRYGRTTVLKYALPVYAIGLVIPLLFTNKLIVAIAVPLFATAGGSIMALPYAVLTPLMPKRHHGALTGFYTFSRGLGTALGPLLAGGAITLFGQSLFAGSQGYQATWGVCALAILTSIPFLHKLRRQEQEAAEAVAEDEASAGTAPAEEDHQTRQGAPARDHQERKNP